ncbi:MAG: DUF559 domain-containing protein [Anaerolineales bacterium]|nr:DUF559 domain-containing protein [Anaerolineales bacterium]
MDGDVHDLLNEEDERRENVLSAMGLRIVRFGNDEVVRDVSAVVGKIRESVNEEMSYLSISAISSHSDGISKTSANSLTHFSMRAISRF